MAYSLMRITSDGTLSTIVLTFPFFDKSHVVVSVGPTELPGGGYTWVWLNSNTIQITPVVSAGVEVVVRRRTPYGDMFNIYDAGAVFNEFTMDENFRQLLFSFQEALESNKSTDVYNDLNIHGYRVTNIGNAVTGRDAVPYAQYQADSQGAYQQRLVCEANATLATTQAGIATSAAATAAADAVAASNALITTTVQDLVAPLSLRVTALEQRKSTCLVNAVGTGAPHETVSAGLPVNITTTINRYVLQNPFGVNTPVNCIAEVFVGGEWINTGFIYDGAGQGVRASYKQGEGIILRTANQYLVGNPIQTGGTSTTTNTATSAPCRVFVMRADY